MYSYPAKTSSGGRFCQPEEEDPKRRRCQPACGSHAPYCHGRCVYFGKACYFAPCSLSPYREDSGDTCSQLAMESVNGTCAESCNDQETESEAAECQDCIEEDLTNLNATSCLNMSGSSCWRCSSQISEDLGQCSETRSDSSEVLQCVQESQSEGCKNCVCTLFCYWSPDSDLCKTCLSEPQASEYFVNHDHCPKGWTWAAETSKCYKTFTEKMPWPNAAAYCKSGNGNAPLSTNI